MKKQLLAGVALFGTLSAFPQLNKTVGEAGILDMKKSRPAATAGVNEVVSPLFGSGVILPKKNSAKGAAQPTAIQWSLLSGSGNVNGMLVNQSRPLQYNPNVNAVTFIHRASVHYSTNPATLANAQSGIIVAEVSSNWGATWDSTAIWADATNWGRYPQGAIYSPAGNTSLANAYVVGCGPTVAGTIFSGDWYASKKLNSFSNSVSSTPGSQQFLSLSLATYPANQRQHGWSRCGFSSTDDGVVRSAAVIENDLQGLTTMRGYAVVTGTFNGAAFDWSVDSLVPSCYLDPSLEKHLQPDPQMAFNQSGTIGYLVGIGAINTGTQCNMGYQPIIYKMDKTSNANATWTLMPSIDFNSMAMRPVVLSHYNSGLRGIYIDSNNDTVGAPYFDDFDIAVDATGKLHIGATIMSTARTTPDSLNYISQFTDVNPTEKYNWRHTPGSRPYLYDFIGDGTSAWQYRIIDSLSTEGPSAAPNYPGFNENPWDNGGPNGIKVAIDSRIQMGRTPDGQYITFSWTESDTLYTNNYFKWNNLPDIKTRCLAVTSGTGSYVVDAGPEQNMTANNINVKTRATLHYMSPVTSSATVLPSTSAFYTVDVNVPFTVTNSNPYAQTFNQSTWYGGSVNSFKFRQPSTVGIGQNNEIITTASIYPNPAQNSAIMVMALDKAAAVDVNIMNTVGQSVRTSTTQGQVGENAIKLDLTGLSTGIYLINIKAGNATATKKLIVE